MGRVCGICGGQIGWKAFRCIDGAVCKDCYRIVSNHYTTAITKMTLEELKQSYQRNSRPIELGKDGFHATRKIGTFLLVDDERKKFCILSSWRLSGKYAPPEVFPFDELMDFRLVSDPAFTEDQLADFAAARDSKETLRRLSVQLTLKHGASRELIVFHTPIRVSSRAFRQSWKLTEELLYGLRTITRISTE